METCPLDSSHRVNLHDVLPHIDQCKKDHPGVFKVTCSCSSVVELANYYTHVMVCSDRIKIRKEAEAQKKKTDDSKTNKNKKSSKKTKSKNEDDFFYPSVSLDVKPKNQFKKEASNKSNNKKNAKKTPQTEKTKKNVKSTVSSSECWYQDGDLPPPEDISKKEKKVKMLISEDPFSAFLPNYMKTPKDTKAVTSYDDTLSKTAGDIKEETAVKMEQTADVVSDLHSGTIHLEDIHEKMYAPVPEELGNCIKNEDLTEQVEATHVDHSKTFSIDNDHGCELNQSVENGEFIANCENVVLKDLDGSFEKDDLGKSTNTVEEIHTEVPNSHADSETATDEHKTNSNQPRRNPDHFVTSVSVLPASKQEISSNVFKTISYFENYNSDVKDIAPSIDHWNTPQETKEICDSKHDLPDTREVANNSKKNLNDKSISSEEMDLKTVSPKVAYKEFKELHAFDDAKSVLSKSQAKKYSAEIIEKSLTILEALSNDETPNQHIGTHDLEIDTKPLDVVTKPLDVVTKPLGEVTKPLDVVTKPLGEVTKPLGEVTKPLGEVTKPLDVVTKPLGEVTKPLGEVTKPLGEVTKPLGEVTKSLDVVTKPLDVVTKPLDVVTKPLDVVTKPLDVVTKPLDVVTKPLDVVTKPLDVVTKPLDVVTKPLDVVTKPLDVVTKPLDVVTKPLNIVTQSQPLNLWTKSQFVDPLKVNIDPKSLDLTTKKIDLTNENLNLPTKPPNFGFQLPAVVSQQLPAAIGSQQLPAAIGSQQLPAVIGSQQLPAAIGSQQLPAAIGSQQLHAVGSQQLPAVGSQQLPAVGSQQLPAVGSQQLPAVGSQQLPAVGSQQLPAVGSQQLPAVGSQQLPAVGSQHLPAVGSQHLPAVGSQHLPAVGSQHLPAVGSQHLPAVGSQHLPAVGSQHLPAVGSQHLPAVGSQHLPAVGSQHLPAVGSQHLPAVGSQHLPAVGSQQLPAAIGSQQLPAAIGSQQLPAAIGSQQLPAVGSQHLPAVGSQHLPAVGSQLPAVGSQLTKNRRTRDAMTYDGATSNNASIGTNSQFVDLGGGGSSNITQSLDNEEYIREMEALLQQGGVLNQMDGCVYMPSLPIHLPKEPENCSKCKVLLQPMPKEKSDQKFDLEVELVKKYTLLENIMMRGAQGDKEDVKKKIQLLEDDYEQIINQYLIYAV